MKSLHQNMEHSSIDLAVRIWANPMQLDIVESLCKKKKFRLLNIPFYLLGFLPQILKNLLGY